MPDLQEKPGEQVPFLAFPKPPGHRVSIPVSVSCQRATSPPHHPQIHGGAITWAVPSPSYRAPRVQGVLNPPILRGSLLEGFSGYPLYRGFLSLPI